MTDTTAAFEGDYQGEKAIWLRAGSYEAAVLPNVGANLIALRDTEKGYRFLHEPAPEEFASFKQAPVIHGIPILFPPNRYEDGKLPWNGKVYELPVNEEATGNHIHGFVHDIPWTVEAYSSDAAASRVTLALRVREGHSVYAHLPHDFTIRLVYTLSRLGLHQQVTVHNEGQDEMPCLLAFHTAINAPFADNATAADYRFRLTIGQRWELSERMLPTGRHQALTAEEARMKGEGLSPFWAPMDNHYTVEAQNGSNRMELTDAKNNVKLVYDAGTAFKMWMIWNNGATEGFFCPEPQLNLVNAPSVALPAEQTGLVALQPGELWESASRIYCVELA